MVCGSFINLQYLLEKIYIFRFFLNIRINFNSSLFFHYFRYFFILYFIIFINYEFFWITLNILVLFLYFYITILIFYSDFKRN